MIIAPITKEHPNSMSTDIETPVQSTNSKHICIDPKDFDHARVVIADPVTSEFTIGNAPIKTTMSAGAYLNDEGEECELYFTAPPQTCFGVNYQYEMNLKEDQQIPENAKGLQICYPATSMKTVDKPTPDEQAYLDMMQALWELGVDKGRQESEREDLLIPAPSAASFGAAEKRKKMDQFLKPPLEHPKAEDKKSLDKSKPKRCYVKLVTTGRGPTLRVTSRFYGPEDKPTSALKFIEKRGIIGPCFKWEGLYWGPHGQAPHGASLRFKLAECTYTPQASSALPSTRMVSKNTSPAQEDDDDYRPPRAEDHTNEAQDFASPGGDDANPAQALSAAAKKPQVKKPVIKAVVGKPKPKAADPKPKIVPRKPPVAEPPAAKAKPKAPTPKVALPPPDEEVVPDDEEPVAD